MVVPGSLYSDLGTKELRSALFDEHSLRALFGISNERYLFKNVHHSFRICIFVAGKGGHTERFDCAFWINPREAIDSTHVAAALRNRSLHIQMTPALVRKTSPDSLSVMEFKGAVDVQIVERMLAFPVLGDKGGGAWKLDLCREFHMTDDSALFRDKPAKGCVPLHEGKTLHQFNTHFAKPRYWVERDEARAALKPARQRRALEAAKASGCTITDEVLDSLSLDSDAYRVGFRKYARNTDERTLIAAVVPPNVFLGESFTVHRAFRDIFPDCKHSEELTLTGSQTLFIVAALNSYVVDWFLRLRVSSTINMFYVEQLPVPRLTKKDPAFAPIVERAAKLTCTTPEFDALAKEVGLGSHANGETNPEMRFALRAEIDGLVAHLYGLTEEEFVHVLKSFPVVSEPQRVAAHNAYRDVARGRLP
jgi:hypothetical protein